MPLPTLVRSVGWVAPALCAASLFAAPPPAKPLDPRINPEKMTEGPLPPPPAAIVQPLPAVHRIAAAHDAESPISAASDARARAAIERGLAWLRTRQTPSGLWLAGAAAAPTDQPDKAEPVALAVTALGIKAFAQAQRGDAPRDPAVDAAISFLRLARGADGAFGGANSANYVNACVASALAAVGDREAVELLRPVVDWLKLGVWDGGEGLAAQKDWYGGAGYGKHGRPDLSNTQMLLDALHDAGVSPEDPAVQATIAFVSRTQNLPATNGAEWSRQGSADGGFVYTAANGGESFASEAAGEGRTGELLPPGTPRSLRSYGSMTYAGFKSLLYAGLSRDDVRVRAAYDWVRRHLSFDENPGLGKQGLFYYYHAMARALSAAQQPTISPLAVDGSEGEAVNWREALIDAIATQQRDDGTWVNSANRWMEDQPELVTIYAVLALEEALKR